MGAVPELAWRTLTLADTHEMASLLAACEANDHTNDSRTADDVADDLTAPGVDLLHGTISGWIGNDLVAYATTRAVPGNRLTIEIVVHPAHRSDWIAERIASWSRQHAHLELHSRTHENQVWLMRVYRAAGYQGVRTYLGMRLDLVTFQPKPVPHPPELPIVPFSAEYDELTRLARNEIFVDTWGSTEMSPAVWTHSLTGSPYFRPEMSFLVLSPAKDKVLSFMLATDLTGKREEIYLANAGTTPSLRGTGLFRSVCLRTVAEAKEQGCRWAVLDVDARNLMAANGFYHRLGFETFRVWTEHVRRPTP